MPFVVRLSEDASADLLNITEYIAQSDSPASALRVLDQIERRLDSLADLPRRGSHVRELEEVGRPGFREILFKPYRIIYRVSDDVVDVVLIADGRRDMSTLLIQRLLQA